jgi:hypothetical protein
MNIEKLLDATSGKGSEFDYLREVVSRLEDALGSELDLTESFMLMDILIHHTFVYDDGFIINDDRPLIRIIGYNEAAAIVATFWDEPTYDWEWFKANCYSERSRSVEVTERRRIRDELLAAILKNPTVHLREYGNEKKRRKQKPPET